MMRQARIGLLFLCTIACADRDSKVPRYDEWEITERTPLLHPNGTLSAWGWARGPLIDYNPARTPEPNRRRLKEWDWYGVTGPDHYLELTLANISWAVMASVSLVDFRTKQVSSNLFLDADSSLLTLPAHAYRSIALQKNAFSISFSYSEIQKSRTLEFDFPQSLVGPNIRGRLVIEDDPEDDLLATAAPFHRPDYFFYTNKIVALPASGDVSVGEKSYSLSSESAHAVLDWGRGVWPEEFQWGWAVAAGMVGGKRFGYSIGFGDEDASRFSGNAVVYDGVLHKLGNIRWSYDADDSMQAWRFQSEDGRFNVTLQPYHDQSTDLDLGDYRMDTTKVHGMIAGEVVLDDGSVLKIENLRGFAERCFQRW